MRLKFLHSASVVIEDKETKILCDPWLLNGEFYNSWGIYPPYSLKPEHFSDIDFIYISHIHPDHLSSLTLKKLNLDVPVLILNFENKNLKNKIQSLGYDVIELNNNIRTKIGKNLNINIIQADNCDPEICSKAFGCGQIETDYKLTPIDSMAIFDNNSQTIVNTNDCPPELSGKTIPIIKQQYSKIDLLLVGYLGASSYPQCFGLSPKELDTEKTKKIQKRLSSAKLYVDILEPEYFLPFAGQYTITGKFSFLNKDRGEPEIDDAYTFFLNQSFKKSTCILLNQNSYFDLDTKYIPKYNKIDSLDKEEYIKNIFSKFKYDYELNEEPSLFKIKKLVPKSYENFEKRRKEIGYSSNNNLVLQLSENIFLVVSCNGEGYYYCDKQNLEILPIYTLIKCDLRLLEWLLQGPKKAHWNVASLGCHLSHLRKPNIFDRGLDYCSNWFYSNSYD